ncbi:hypothetical protein LOAG_16010, partial [Loa loa]
MLLLLERNEKVDRSCGICKIEKPESRKGSITLLPDDSQKHPTVICQYRIF